MGAQWFGGAELVTRAPYTGLGADGDASWITFGGAALLFPSTYNPTERSEIYQWRDEARGVLLNTGFENFRDLYNGNVSNSAEWDRSQLKSEQAALQPVHEKYLGERTLFNWITKKATDSESSPNVGMLWGSNEEQVVPGGIDMLSEDSRVNFGCKLLKQQEGEC